MILDNYFLFKVVGLHIYKKKGFTLRFKPTENIGTTALEQRFFNEFIESLNKITARKITSGHSENSTKMYYLIDDTTMKKLKIQAELGLAETFEEDSESLRFMNFNKAVELCEKDTNKTYTIPRTGDELKLENTSGEIKLTYDDITYTVHKTVPEDTRDGDYTKFA